jgi:iron complex transport system substrate-binding protein
MRRALLAAALALAACGDPPAARAPADGPRRIVSLAPSITETVYALGAGDRLVGVCAQCDFPEAAAKLPRVGGYMVPSVEAVIAARPDVVLVVPSPGNRDAVRAIEQAGVRVVVVGDRTLADLWAAIRTIAGALAMPEAGERLVQDVEGRLGKVRGRVAGLPTRRTLLVVDHRPLVVAGAGTLQDELVTLAGGTNVAADIGSVWPELSLEVIVARAPEVIVDATVVMRADEVKDFFAGLTTVPAVRAGRVITLGSEAILRAGPRVSEAAAALAAAIHPEAFAAG